MPLVRVCTWVCGRLVQEAMCVCVWHKRYGLAPCRHAALRVIRHLQLWNMQVQASTHMGRGVNMPFGGSPLMHACLACICTCMRAPPLPTALRAGD
jgi:hypothetical protein